MLSISCAPSWLYLQDYTEMHYQQNMKFSQFSLVFQSCIQSFCQSVSQLPVPALYMRWSPSDMTPDVYVLYRTVSISAQSQRHCNSKLAVCF